MLRFFVRHWRGELSPWVSGLLVSLVFPAALYFEGLRRIPPQIVDYTPQERWRYLLAFLSLVSLIGVWQLVGSWRAGSQSRHPARGRMARWSARLFAVASAAVSVWLLSMMSGGLRELTLTANDGDEIGRKGYKLSVSSDRIQVDGWLTWKLLDEFAKTIGGNSQIKTVVLNSPGGHVAVGWRLANLVKARGYDTLTTEMCASACTAVFLGGNNRRLRRGARLGFHDVSGTSMTEGLSAARERMAAQFRVAGVPEAFIRRALSTPAADVWFPTVDELRKANIITEIAR